MIVFRRLSLFFLFVFLISLPAAAASENSGRYDGPAELPRVTVRSAVADSRAPGQVVVVKEGDNLQAALNNASCGDTIRLQAGATFVGTFFGAFLFPAKPCDDQHWIIIRSDVADSQLPPEGTRITPCYSGVPAMPGRPPYSCPSPRNVLAKIVYGGKAGDGPIVFQLGANHYRFQAVEITRGTPGADIRSLVSFRSVVTRSDGLPHWNSKSDHIIFDRDWIHGDEKDETNAGVSLGGVTDAAVVDSYINDIKCIARTGSCTDAHAIGGGAGDNPMGPYKIENNFLEASGECILFGGAPASATPADIEIRRNHLFRPIQWKSDEPGFMGANSGNPFIVKNLFELKNAQRLLFEDNSLENSWGGFTQTGFAIVLTPKSQGKNMCPLCRVTDITIRYNRISHCASGFQIANVPTAANGVATAGERYSIHDVVIDDIDPVRYKGFGVIFQIISRQPALRDVTIDHVTAFSPKAMFNIGGFPPSPKISGFTFTNNLLGAGDRDVSSTGGGQENCSFLAQRAGAKALFDDCFSSPVVVHNVILHPQGSWPKDNFTPKNAADAGLPSERPASLSGFLLCQEKNEAVGCKRPSPFLHAASAGGAVGADIIAVQSAVAAAE
jgi:hypothetical protein